MNSKRIDIDWITVTTYLLLVCIGWLAIYTADFDENHPEIFYQGRSYGRQLIWIVTSLILGFIIQILDTRFYTAFAYVIYAVFMLLLVGTLVFGSEISGSKSWIRLGFFNIQPAEFAKFATCLAISKYLSSLNVTLDNMKDRFIVFIFISIPVILILLQGDAGSAIVYVALILALYREGLSGGILVLGVVATILFIFSLLTSFYVIMGGVALIGMLILFYKVRDRWKAIAIFAISVVLGGIANYYADPLIVLVCFLVAALLFFIVFWSTKRLVFGMLTLLFVCSIYTKGVDYIFHNILKERHRNRIGVILGIIEDNRGVGYNLNQSKIAIGSGGTWGKGFLQGTQNKGNFVPELRTDFIFCTIGEEFGFVGSTILILLFLFLLMRLVHLSERQRSRFSRIYGYGVVSIFFFHFTINIGMTVGLVPVIGIPLPLISYGGSSLIGFTTLLFIMIKLDSERLLYLR